MEKLERLSKIMSQRGLCSRREADTLISQKLVKVNGQLVTELGVKVTPNVKIEILKQGQKNLENKMTLAMNKPRDFVSSQPEKNYRTALELVRKENYFGEGYKPFIQKGLAPLGRLDIDSTGLILYSQNGSLAKKIIGENSDVEKEYEVNVEGKLDEKKLKLLTHGLSLDGVKLKRARVKKLSDRMFLITLKQGRKRQIRRMCEAVGLKTTRIHRIRIGSLKIGDLPEGKWMFVKDSSIL